MSNYNCKEYGVIFDYGIVTYKHRLDLHDWTFKIKHKGNMSIEL